MGLFDYRCMVSGLSLKSSKTVLVLLEKSGDSYLPIALPVVGQYNRLGGIDMIDEDQNTNNILTFFQSKINSGAVRIDWEEVYWEGAPLKTIENIEQLLASIERSVTMEYDCVTLNNNRIEYSLIDSGLWDELIHFDPESNRSNFIQSDTWKEIYKNPVSGYESFIHQFNNVQGFLNKHSINWTPPTDASQHYEKEVNEYLEAAKSKFINEPLIMKGILAYTKN